MHKGGGHDHDTVFFLAFFPQAYDNEDDDHDENNDDDNLSEYEVHNCQPGGSS